VQIVRPAGWLSSRGASALWGVDPRWAALRYGGLTAIGLMLVSWAWPRLNWPAVLADLRTLLAEMEENVGVAALAIVVVLWSLIIIGAAIQFARVLPDHVRLTVGPHHGFVFNAALLDPSTGRAGRIGSTPELAGAPIAARELGRAFHRTVRSIEGPAESLDGKVRTWTYELGYGTDVERESYVRVHLARGAEGFAALAGPQNRDALPKRTWLERLAERNAASGRGWLPDYDWWEFGDLLIVRKGEFVIGFEQARGMELMKWHANAARRLALGAFKSVSPDAAG
jgi:hypothetical protein